MSEQDPLDKLFQSKMSQRSFAFDEQAWAAAEQMIVTQEKKGTPFWWFFGGSVAAAALALMLFWPFGAAEKTIKATLAEVPSKQEQLIETTNPTTAEPVSVSSESSVSGPAKKRDKADVATVPEASNELEARQTEATGEPPIAQVEETTVTKEVADEKPASTPKELAVVSDEAPKTNTQKPLVKDEPILTLYEPADPFFDNMSKQAASSITEDTEEEQDGFRLALLTPELPRPDWDRELKLQPVMLADPTGNPVRLIQKFSAGFILAPTISQGFQNKGINRAKSSLSLTPGLRLSYHLNSQVSLNINSLYYSRSGLNSAVSFVNSSSTQTTTLTPLSLHYLDLPMYFDIKVTEVASFQLGLQYSMLLTTRTQRDRVTTGQNGEATAESTILWNQKDGFARSDASLLLGAQYQITERITVGGRFNFGAFDVTDDDYFFNDVRDLNRSFRLTIDYRFLH